MGISPVSIQPTVMPSCKCRCIKQTDLKIAIALAKHKPKPLNPDRFTLQAADTMHPLVSTVGATILVATVVIPIVVTVCKFARLMFSIIQENLPPW